MYELEGKFKMNQNDLLLDIYDFYEIPLWQTLWFQIPIGIITLLLVGSIVYFILHRKKPKLSAWEIARQQLSLINLERCSNKQDFKKVYFDITTILKSYIQERYQWDIIDKTDDEMIAYLTKNEFNPELLEAIKKLLYGSSLVKYADEVALKTQVDVDLKLAFDFIKKTIPSE